MQVGADLHDEYHCADTAACRYELLNWIGRRDSVPTFIPHQDRGAHSSRTSGAQPMHTEAPGQNRGSSSVLRDH
jgi:hypothetical protein